MARRLFPCSTTPMSSTKRACGGGSLGFTGKRIDSRGVVSRGRVSFPSPLFLPRRGDHARLASKILRPQFDRRTMWRAIGGAVPGIAIAMQGFGRCNAFRGDEFLQCREPMPVVGLAG